MSAPQGIISFPGLTEYILSGQFTLGHGISPSMCTLVCTPIPGRLREVGSLDLRYGSNRLVFPDCKVDSVRGDIAEDGLERWTVTVLDRRWKWKFGGAVSGFYNVRISGGNQIQKGTNKNIRELMVICLQAMGEERFDVRDVPEVAFPETEWDYTPAPQALAQLCDRLGFRVVLEANNRIAIRKVGVGRTLPIMNLEIQLTKALDPPERPDEVIFVGGPNLYQNDLLLEAIMEDLDGVSKPINEVVFAPRDELGKPDWRFYDIGFGYNIKSSGDEALDARIYKIVVRDLYRRYRVKEPVIFSPDGVNVAKLKRAQILPLVNRLLETKLAGNPAEGQQFVPIEPFIYGLWNNKQGGFESTFHKVAADGLEQPPTGKLTDPEKTAIFTGSFSVDEERGEVYFSEPVYRQWPMTPAERMPPIAGLEAELRPPAYYPAHLYLRIIHYRRNKETRAFVHREERRRMPGPRQGTRPEFLKVPDVSFDRILKRNVAASDNNAEFLAQAKHYLDAKQAEYQLADFGSYTYVGFHAINPDGALQQISWEVTGDGKAYTRASRNREELLATVSYQERRLFERVKFQLDEAEKRRGGA